MRFDHDSNKLVLQSDRQYELSDWQRKFGVALVIIGFSIIVGCLLVLWMKVAWWFRTAEWSGFALRNIWTYLELPLPATEMRGPEKILEWLLKLPALFVFWMVGWGFCLLGMEIQKAADARKVKPDPKVRRTL